ncbi:putative reverse transcriptase domain-containing protein [Tanacetum coccineum]
MDLLNQVCKPYLDKFLIVFIDDILIYSSNENDYEEHLKLILELLKKEELYAKFSKCEFWLPKVQFLSHVIDSEGIHIDPAKIKSIKDWASPKTPMEIHQFLGLAGYYRRFIKAKEFATYLGSEGVEHVTTSMVGIMSDYDCEISYHLGKTNVVADALSRKERIKPLRVRALVMIIGLNLPSQILNAQAEAIKEENILEEIFVDKAETKRFGFVGLNRVPYWKWEKITMDFVTKLPRTVSSPDTIWVIVDRLTKSAHFLPIKETDSMEKLTRLYLKEVVSRHGVPVSIISDRDSRFTFHFWQSLRKL